MNTPLNETVQTYVKRPVEFQAIQLTPDSYDSCVEFLGEENYRFGASDGDNVRIEIKTLEGITVAHSGWYIIKGIKGEFYACEPEIFEKSNKLVQTQESETTGYVVVNEATGAISSRLFHGLSNANARRNQSNRGCAWYRKPETYATYKFNVKLSDMKRMPDKK